MVAVFFKINVKPHPNLLNVEMEIVRPIKVKIAVLVPKIVEHVLEVEVVQAVVLPVPKILTVILLEQPILHVLMVSVGMIVPVEATVEVGDVTFHLLKFALIQGQLFVVPVTDVYHQAIQSGIPVRMMVDAGHIPSVLLPLPQIL